MAARGCGERRRQRGGQGWRTVDFGAGDKLDFTGLFGNSHPADPALLIHVTDTTAGSVVADLGTGQFVDVVVLDGVHGLTIDDLVHNHVIVV